MDLGLAQLHRRIRQTGWRTPRASRKNTPREGRNPYRNQPDFHRKAVRSRRFLLTMRPISYIMLTKKSRLIRASSRLRPGAVPAPPSLLLLVGGFPGFLLGEFVVDV